MTDRLIRLMRIITLVQAKPGILARELAERCSTSERTIYRDMEALSAMHIPITHLGYGKGYQFIGRFALYPFDWTEDELEAFTTVAQVMNQIKPLLPEGFEGAYEKVMAAYHKQKVDRMETELQEGEHHQPGKTVSTQSGEEQSEYLMPILLATLSQQIIQAEYYIPERNELLYGKIDPYLLIPWQRRFYLVGRNHNTGEMYTYRLNRFERVVVLDDVFIKVHTHTQQEWQNYFRGKEEESVAFKIRLSSAVIPKYKEKTFITPIAETAATDGSIIIDLTISDVREFLSWLSQYGSEAEILEPVQYREMMKHQLKKWLAVYG
ncbi:WYL domain-containing protein [Paenibacillus sp. HJL G12]|uniref:WYL domain-containing protein n=1 Tax=Paenibacillus dendrobii TaxID=2691084 RepID=A0A7X3LK44_9BACL|nr:WYL domain-containing protein [Paenibacillus dendrobii]MWV46925.1 WYL domain-containing protein [Paenibacillus dendrobii]